MKSFILLFSAISILLLSCDSIPNDQESKNNLVIDSLENEIKSLELLRDSLLQELVYVAQLNENIYQEREAALKELNALKKKYKIGSSSSSNPLAKYNLELTRSKTGYVYSTPDALFLPAITLEFRNKTNVDLNERVYFKYLFVNKKTGEQLHESMETFCDSYSSLAGGLVKQITERSEVGWYAIRDQDVSVRVYIRDVFWKEFQIETSTYQGRI